MPDQTDNPPKKSRKEAPSRDALMSDIRHLETLLKSSVSAHNKNWLRVKIGKLAAQASLSEPQMDSFGVDFAIRDFERIVDTKTSSDGNRRRLLVSDRVCDLKRLQARLQRLEDSLGDAMKEGDVSRVSRVCSAAQSCSMLQ